MIIVCGEINQDVTDNDIQSYFTSLGLHNLIFLRHPSNRAPATYNRNTTNTSIDGVWASVNLNLIRGGYLDYDDFPGDYRALWFDLSITQLFGCNLTPIWKPQARRLQLRDPRVVSRYNSILTSQLLVHDLPNRLFRLEADIANNRPTHDQELLYSQIDAETMTAMLYAESKCRKLRMGAVQFSELTNRLRKQIFFWSMAISRHQGKYIHPRRWQRAKHAARISKPTHSLDLPSMIT